MCAKRNGVRRGTWLLNSMAEYDSSPPTETLVSSEHNTRINKQAYVITRDSAGNKTRLIRSKLCSQLWLQPLHFWIDEYSALFLCGGTHSSSLSKHFRHTAYKSSPISQFDALLDRLQT